MFNPIICFLVLLATLKASVVSGQKNNFIWCYVCNLHDPDCHSVVSRTIKPRFLQKCYSGFCTNLISQKSNIEVRYTRKINLRRECGNIGTCSDPAAYCCSCNKDQCNGDMLCGAANKLEMKLLNFCISILAIAIIL